MLFNEGNSYLVFTYKQLCLFVTIFSGFGAIVCFGFNNMFAAFSALLFADIMVVYSVVYEKAFAIPDGVQELKNKLMLLVHGKNMIWRREVEILRRQIRAVPSFGIRVGVFHMMERTSTPIFIDFVLRSVVNLLVLTK